MATQASSSFTLTRPSLSGLNVAHFLKLTNFNYLLWLSRMKSFLLGHNLFGYVDGMTPAPATTPPTADEEPIKPNLVFSLWFQIDQLVVNYLTSTISEPILSLTIGKISAEDIWDCLDAQFSQASLVMPQSLASTFGTYKRLPLHL